MTMLERKDVPRDQTWNKEGVYPTWDHWQAEFEEAKVDLKMLSEYQSTLGQEPEILVSWFELYSSQIQRLMRLFSYTHMHISVDTKDAEAKGYYGQAVGLYSHFIASIAFVEPEILASGEMISEWAENHPSLAAYKHYIDKILRLKPHKRSQEVEELLGMLEESFDGASRTASELTNSDLKFADAVDSQGQLQPVLQATIAPTGVQSADLLQRKSAWESYADGYLSMENTLASSYLTNIKQWLFLARTRGYESILEHMLSPTNTPVEVFHTLIDSFKHNLPVWHKYWDVKRKILGQDKIPL